MKYLVALLLFTGCGGTDGASVDAPSASSDAATVASPSDRTVGDFERATLGAQLGRDLSLARNTQVQIIDNSDVGMGPGPQGLTKR